MTLAAPRKLLLACALLAVFSFLGVIAWKASRESPASAPARAKEDRGRQVAVELVELLAATEQQGTGKDPFAPPAEVKPREAPPLPAPPFQMRGWARLQGVDYALVAEEGKPERYVGAGETISGWRVAQILPDAVTVNKDGQSVVVKLKESFSLTPLGR